MHRIGSIVVALSTLSILAGCANSGGSQVTSEQENRRELCQKWVGNPDDPECLSTFRRILP